VRIDFFTQALCYILTKLEEFHRLSWNYPNYPKDVYITSIADGNHMVNSQHYKGTAIDIRSKNFGSETAKSIFRSRFENFLGPKFRVLYESKGEPNEHFHVQIKKGETFP
jgi:hypothetical protein